MSDDRVVDAIENAANETIIFQAESQIEAIRRARKRRKSTEGKYLIYRWLLHLLRKDWRVLESELLVEVVRKTAPTQYIFK